MPPGFQPEHLSSPTILLGLVVVLILAGALVPRWLHKSVMTRADKERDDWRDTATKQSEQISELLEQSKTALHIGEEIKRLAERGDD
ncbi:hypothetical protein [Rhodococcus marinonascens]|uniref:hypothetical protein n=1 Tax=Rhodococcus marinonascens TaxID=38311 RepID=UPI000934130E|nr:hypothetical protein [Rhodococcus marinonascens]